MFTTLPLVDSLKTFDICSQIHHERINTHINTLKLPPHSSLRALRYLIMGRNSMQIGDVLRGYRGAEEL